MCVWGGGCGKVFVVCLFVFFKLGKLHKMYYFGTMDQAFFFLFFFCSICVLLFPKDPHHCKIFYPVPKIDKTHYYSSNTIFISQKDVNFVPCKPSSFCTLHMEACIPILAFKQDNAWKTIMQPSMHVLTLLRMANSSHKAQKSHCISLK